MEALLVEDGFQREIPSEFDALPRLQGRATLTISTSQGDLTTVVDGYNAPLTAGAFVDLAQKGFYDGLPFVRAEDFYVLQSGDPEGPELGYIDPKPNRSGTYRLRSASRTKRTPFTTKPLRMSACSRPPQPFLSPPLEPWDGPIRIRPWMMAPPSSSCFSTRLN